jgi:hypothetical protein
MVGTRILRFLGSRVCFWGVVLNCLTGKPSSDPDIGIMQFDVEGFEEPR